MAPMRAYLPIASPVIRPITIKPAIQIIPPHNFRPIVSPATRPDPDGPLPHLIMTNISRFIVASIVKAKHGILVWNAIRTLVIMPYLIASIATVMITIKTKAA